MADHERRSSSTKYRSGTHLDSSIGQSRNPERSGLVMSSEERRHDSNKSENRSDREHDSGSFRASREQRVLYQGHSQSDKGTARRRHTQYDYNSDRSHHRHADSEDRRSAKHRWNTNDRPKMINSHERFGRVDDTYERESLNGHRTTDASSANERHRPIRGQEVTFERLRERYDKKDEPDLRKVEHERRQPWDNEHLQKTHDNYNRKEEESRRRSPASVHLYSSSDVTALKSGHKVAYDNVLEERKSTADHHSEHRHRHRDRHPDSSRKWPSSRGSSRSRSSASDDTDDSRGRGMLKEGSFSRRRSRSPSYSGSVPRSEGYDRRGRSRSRSPSKSHSSANNKSSHNRKHSKKRKHRDRSGSRDSRKRRKPKEKEREKDKEISREKEKMKKKDEERRSVLTGKKIKLKVKKDKGDHERDANRKDLLQFLNSAFE